MRLFSALLLLLPLAAVSQEAVPPQEERQGGLRGADAVYQSNCAVCHGERMEGAAQGTPLLGVDLVHGDTMESLTQSIAEGFPDKGMPAWSNTFTDQEIKSMVLWISEHRDGLLYSEFNITSELTIPAEPIETELYTLSLDVVATGIDPLPYSISPLPDGSILVTEKMKGLRVISPQGELSDLISGTPRVYGNEREDATRLPRGHGWLMDVAIHPAYEENGWIYLVYSDRCEDCNTVSREEGKPVSMIAVVRGRIKEGAWIDEEVIYKADPEHYTTFTDLAAGGRITFDPDGFVFFSSGWKSMEGLQSLQSPHGKIHRLHDDGRIPTDNPYSDHPDHPDALKSIWTYGHRSPQGLEFNNRTRTLWGTEHGPRGGDEVNLLLPGRNYGWPLYSLGQNYDGTKVDWGKELGIEFEVKDIQQPVVDMTPSPAISSFVFYEGNTFAGWDGDVIVGSLKAADLFRVRLRDNKPVHQELLIENLARIRDIETATDGSLLLLLEHISGGQVVRVSPVNRMAAARH